MELDSICAHCANHSFESPQTDDALRRRITRIRERHGSEHLHRLLKRVDPLGADRFFPRDWPLCTTRIGSLSSDRPINRSPAKPAARGPRKYQATSYFVAKSLRETSSTKESTNAPNCISSSGLVDEVRALLAKGVPSQSNALGAHGYRRVVEFLAGQRTLVNAIEQTKLDIRHYAKRQLTWFRHEEGVEWFDGFGEETPNSAIRFGKYPKSLTDQIIIFLSHLYESLVSP